MGSFGCNVDERWRFVVLEATVSPLIAWGNFYVIVGTAAATLTGLMFVALTLISQMRDHVSGAGVSTFSTPSIVHFGSALLIAVLLSAPWPMLWMAGVPLGLAGLGGVIYTGVVLQRVRQMAEYQPVIEDWLFHTIFPFVAYTAQIVAAVLLSGHPASALFVVGAAAVLLLFIGLHNAWDNVAYNVTTRIDIERQKRDE